MNSQKTQQEHHGYSDPLNEFDPQLPHMIRGHSQNNKVGKDIGYSVPDKYGSEVQTRSCYGGVPGSADRAALENTNKDERQRPADGD